MSKISESKIKWNSWKPESVSGFVPIGRKGLTSSEKRTILKQELRLLVIDKIKTRENWNDVLENWWKNPPFEPILYAIITIKHRTTQQKTFFMIYLSRLPGLMPHALKTVFSQSEIDVDVNQTVKRQSSGKEKCALVALPDTLERVIEGQEEWFENEFNCTICEIWGGRLGPVRFNPGTENDDDRGERLRTFLSSVRPIAEAYSAIKEIVNQKRRW